MTTRMQQLIMGNIKPGETPSRAALILMLAAENRKNNKNVQARKHSATPLTGRRLRKEDFLSGRHSENSQLGKVIIPTPSNPFTRTNDK